MIKANSVSLKSILDELDFSKKIAFYVDANKDEYACAYDGVYINDDGQVVICIVADDSDNDTAISISTLLTDIKLLTRKEDTNSIEIVFEYDINGECNYAGFNDIDNFYTTQLIYASTDRTYIESENN